MAAATLRATTTDRLVGLLRGCCAAERRALQDELIVANIGVAERIARRLRHGEIPDEDLRQVALEGLVKAVRRFDPHAGHDLLSYAVPTIRGEIQRYVRDHGTVIRTPRGTRELQLKVRDAGDELTQRLGRSPRPAEVAEMLGVTEEAVVEALVAGPRVRALCLDQPLPGEDSETTVGDLVAAEDDAVHDLAELRSILGDTLRRLSCRDRELLYRRFFEQATQREIGAALGMSQVQVSRGLDRILTSVRQEVAGGDPSSQGKVALSGRRAPAHVAAGCSPAAAAPGAGPGC